jgi:hypothetical protein
VRVVSRPPPVERRTGDAKARRARTVVGEGGFHVPAAVGKKRCLKRLGGPFVEEEELLELSAPPSIEARRKLTVIGRFLRPDAAAVVPLMAWNQIGS